MEFLPQKRSGVSSPPPIFNNVNMTQWRLDMKAEEYMGLAPAPWSTSSQMNDPRPNGRSIFDARFVESPMGRARAGRGSWDPRGVVFGGDALGMAAEMADETAAAAKSADKFKLQPNDVRDGATGVMRRVK